MVFESWKKKRREIELEEDKKEASVWKQQFLGSLNKLAAADKTRLEYAKSVAEAGSNVDKLVIACGELKTSTDQSSEELDKLDDLLNEIKNKFNHNIASLPKEERANEFIEKVLLLQRRYGNLVKDIIKMRKKESARLEYLVKNLHHLGTKGLSWWMKRTMKKIFTELQKENKLMSELESNHHYDLEIVEYIKKMYLKEEVKQKVMVVGMAAVWLTPFIGTALAVLSKEMFDYVNQFTNNYKLLQAYVK